MRPLSIPDDIQKYWVGDFNFEALTSQTREAYNKITSANPDVTIVIPAYNEEKTIARTLHSICRNTTTYSVEVIVVNNNS